MGVHTVGEQESNITCRIILQRQGYRCCSVRGNCDLWVVERVPNTDVRKVAEIGVEIGEASGQQVGLQVAYLRLGNRQRCLVLRDG